MYVEEISRARTIVWNGPMGVFEWEPFAEGTLRMARGLAKLNGRVVVGGGDSVAACRLAGVTEKLWHVSTGGGGHAGVPPGEGSARS